METYIYPTHSGGYVAHVGTWDDYGVLSQTVTIPEGSVAEFSMWYATFTGNLGTTSLEVRLSSGDKTIASWNGVIDYYGRYTLEWRRIAYTIGQEFGGKEVTVYIKGHGDVRYYSSGGGRGMADRPSGAQVTPIYYPHEFPNPFTTIYVYPHVDDVSLTYRKVVFKSSVTVDGLPAGQQVRLHVDGRLNTTLQGQASFSLTFPVNTTHTISFDAIQSGDGERYMCTPNQVTVSRDGPVRLTCERQVLLRIESLHGDAAGGGWYALGSKARVSLSSTIAPADGVLRLLGVQFRFAGWSDSSLPPTSPIDVSMERPMTIRAEWVTDYGAAMPLVATAAGIFVVILAVLWKKRSA